MAVLTTKIDFWGKWSAERLKLKSEEVGSREFDRGWRQRALTDSETVFKEEFIKKCLDEHEEIYFPDSLSSLSAILRPREEFYMGVDLAIAGSKSRGDYFVITVVGVNPERTKKRIVSIFRERGLTFHNQLLVAERWADYFKVKLIVVENNAYQDAFHQELKRTTFLPIQPFTTTALNKNDLETGLPRLAVDFEKGLWTIPYKGGNTRELCGALVNELSVYPIGKHDDMIMSLWFAARAAAWNANKVEKRIFVV